nr:hypothetical protein [Tanacetum cinerariifolium]
ELIYRVLELLVLLLELNQFKILLGEMGEGQIASDGWPFVFVVPGQMTCLVASMTLDSARSCVMQGTFLTQGKASSIPTVFSWGGSLSPKGFMPSILLLAVIIVAVPIVVAVVLVVIDAIIRVIVIVGGVSSIIKLSFVIIGGKISSGQKKYQELSDVDNIGDGCRIVGGVIGACGGASEAKRSLVKSFEGSREVFPSEAGK